jgi:hypothetical protein
MIRRDDFRLLFLPYLWVLMQLMAAAAFNSSTSLTTLYALVALSAYAIGWADFSRGRRASKCPPPVPAIRG